MGWAADRGADGALVLVCSSHPKPAQPDTEALHVRVRRFPFGVGQRYQSPVTLNSRCYFPARCSNQATQDPSPYIVSDPRTTQGFHMQERQKRIGSDRPGMA